MAETSGASAVTDEERQEQTRKKKWENVLSSVKKGRMKEFVPGSNIKKYIEALEEECIVQCQYYGLDYETGIASAVKVLLLRSKLTHDIVIELKGCCVQENTTIEDIEYATFKKVVIKQCGIVTPVVNIVMQYFGPDREIQAEDTPLLTHNISL